MSENQQGRTFADGFIFKRNEKDPEFVIGRISVKVDEAITFLKNNEKKGWVNLQIKRGRSGNPYIDLDNFEPKAKAEAKPKQAPATEPEEDGDLPF
jgi:hypothetical protein